MAKKVWDAGALLAPLPAVLVTSRYNGVSDVMTAAWTGIINTKPSKTYISVRKSRFSYDLIRNSGVFAINLTTESLAFAADFCGVRSGRDIDKFERCSRLP